MIGRFITPDTYVQAPLDPQTLNRYSYCRNNPLIYTDPSGHFAWLIIGAIIGAITSAISGGNIAQGAILGAFGGFLSFATGAAVLAGMGVTQASATAFQLAAANAIGAFAAGTITGFIAGGKGRDVLVGSLIGAGLSFGITYAAASSNGAPAHKNFATAADSQIEKLQDVISENTIGGGRGNLDISTLAARKLAEKGDLLMVRIGSRPALGPERHMFAMWEDAGQTKYFEMGFDGNGNIAVNPLKTRATTDYFINKRPSDVKWGLAIVSKNLFYQNIASYKATWTGFSYFDTYKVFPWANSNYAIRYIVNGSGGEILGDLGPCPGDYPSGN